MYGVCVSYFLFISFLLTFLCCLFSSSHIHFHLLLISPEIRSSVACASQTLLALANNTHTEQFNCNGIWIRAYFDGMQINGFAYVSSAYMLILLVSNRTEKATYWHGCDASNMYSNAIIAGSSLYFGAGEWNGTVGQCESNRTCRWHPINIDTIIITANIVSRWH